MPDVAKAKRLQSSRLRMLGFLRKPQPTKAAALQPLYIRAKKSRYPSSGLIQSKPYAQRSYTASTTHSAVMLTMRLTVADGVRICTGLAQPSSTGPIAMPLPAVVLSRL
jgi:hypothetical protein